MAQDFKKCQKITPYFSSQLPQVNATGCEPPRCKGDIMLKPMNRRDILSLALEEG